jgi:hypothetical protein
MRLFSTISIFVISFTLWTCNNIEDAPPSSRDTFLKIYDGTYSTVATDLEIGPDGYVILGNMSVTADSVVTVIFKTDRQGNRISDFKYFLGGTGRSLKHISSPFDGYIVIGSSIKSDPSSPLVANIDVASAQILVLDEDLQEIANTTLSDTTESDGNPHLFDYYGESVTVTDDGRVILLGTYREGVSNQLQVPLKPFILALTPTLQRDWLRVYDLINRNYNNGRSIHYYNNKIFWTSSIERIQDNLTFSYASIPVVQDQSVFVNYSLVGESSDQVFAPKDICPAKNPAFGFGVVGTYSVTTDGAQSNIFFLRTDANGTIDPASIQYFDAIGSALGEPVANNASLIVDNGETLTSTSDGGFVIAGTLDSNPQLGKGLRDVVLIKLDAFGQMKWIKKFGGAGDDEVVSIIETLDQGLILCGTSTIGTYSIPFLIKADKNGELKN